MKRILCQISLLLGLYLGISNGNLAIFEDGRTKPMLILPYKAQYYTETDQQLLKKGIPFENRHELQQLLEDFMS